MLSVLNTVISTIRILLYINKSPNTDDIIKVITVIVIRIRCYSNSMLSN